MVARRLPLLTVVAVAAMTCAAAGEPEAILAEIESLALAPDRAVEVRDVSLNLGVGTLRLDAGTLVPTTPVAGAVVEVVFVGEGRIELAPPDDVEAGQLELFTGATTLDERVTEAVFVVCVDAAARVLLDRDPGATPSAESLERARARYATWRGSVERRRADVPAAIWLDALGDPYYSGYFAAAFHGENLGDFLLVIDPAGDEQVTLGRFVPLEADADVERMTETALYRERLRGRFTEVRFDDLGTWDTWLSTRSRTPDGQPYAGGPAFEPRHYAIDAQIGRKGLEIDGVATIRLVATTGRRRVVRLGAFSDIEVTSVRGPDGTDLPRLDAGGGEVFALLPAPPAPGEEVEIAVEFDGVVIEKVDNKVFRLRETRLWHPHVGLVDRATYDVRLEWPERFDLVASGRLVHEGAGESKRRWEHRVIDVPTGGFSFEIGRFDERVAEAGHVRIRVAFDRQVRRAPEETRDQIVAAVVDSLEFFEETFGPYPLDEMTVVTVPRGRSQGMLGFVSLANLLVWDFGVVGDLLGIEDRRTVVAHEVAHQWWGNLVDVASYRDRWLVEGMATYSALVWAQRRLEDDERPRVGPVSGWQSILSDSTEEFRPIESLGPVVLGPRLNSTLSDSAYGGIVYRKGAVVINMLGQALGEEFFLDTLRRIVAAAAGKQLDTATFIALCERASGSDLGWFSERYVYGTGVPEVYYSFDFEERGEGSWVVTGVIRQQASHRTHYAIVAHPEAGWDLRQVTLASTDVEESVLVVPFQIAVVDPDATEDEDDDEQHLVVHGRLQLAEPVYEFELPLEHEPTDFWLDRDGVVFARFYAESRFPKRILMRHAEDAESEGDLDAAIAFLERALEAEDHVEPSGESDSSARGRPDADAALLDAATHLGLAWLHLHRSDVAPAREEIAAARDQDGIDAERRFEEQLDVIEARLALLEGEPERAVKLLKKGVRGRTRMVTLEGYLVLAIAAHETGDDELYEAAIDVARRRGADVELLEAARAAADPG